MQGIELVAIFSLLSSLFSLFSAPSSLLSSALDSRNRIPAFLQGIMRPRGLPPCRNAAIRDGPGANKPCCQSIWGSLAAFFVISSLFPLLASLATARPGKVQTLSQFSCSLFFEGFYGLSLRSSLLFVRVRFFAFLPRLSLPSVHEAINGVPYCFVPWRHPDPHPDVVFSSKCLPGSSSSDRSEK